MALKFDDIAIKVIGSPHEQHKNNTLKEGQKKSEEHNNFSINFQNVDGSFSNISDLYIKNCYSAKLN